MRDVGEIARVLGRFALDVGVGRRGGAARHGDIVVRELQLVLARHCAKRLAEEPHRIVRSGVCA